MRSNVGILLISILVEVPCIRGRHYTLYYLTIAKEFQFTRVNYSCLKSLVQGPGRQQTSPMLVNESLARGFESRKLGKRR